MKDSDIVQHPVAIDSQTSHVDVIIKGKITLPWKMEYETEGEGMRPTNKTWIPSSSSSSLADPIDRTGMRMREMMHQIPTITD